jgi:prevent-host-death family protein
MDSSEVGIRELKDKVSGYIERAEAGEVVTVTRRGKPVARIVPVERADEVEALAAADAVQWRGRKPRLPRPAPLSGGGKTAADYVAEGRR